jgi:hypothetical protein
MHNYSGFRHPQYTIWVKRGESSTVNRIVYYAYFMHKSSIPFTTVPNRILRMHKSTLNMHENAYFMHKSSIPFATVPNRILRMHKSTIITANANLPMCCQAHLTLSLPWLMVLWWVKHVWKITSVLQSSSNVVTATAIDCQSKGSPTEATPHSLGPPEVVPGSKGWLQARGKQGEGEEQGEGESPQLERARAKL